MSFIEKSLLLAPPTSGSSKTGEALTVPGFKCPTCDGRGGFNNGGYMIKFKKNLSDPDWEICRQCKGTGELEAKIVIGWNPIGEIKSYLIDE